MVVKLLNVTFVDGNDRNSSTGSVISIYRGALTNSSARFYRLSSPSPRQNYYDPISIRVSKDGVYDFTSKSDIDMYGYLYRSPFDATNVYSNHLTHDDDSGGSLQFYFQYFLQSNRSYVLIATTYASGVTGSFTIQITGPSNVTYN